MKKIFCIVMVLFLVVAFVGCNSSDSPPVTESSSKPELTSASEQESEPAQKEDVAELTPALEMVETIKGLYSDAGTGLYIASGGWDESTRCTTAIVSKAVHVWIFSLEKDSEVVGASIIGMYTKTDDFERFALEFAFTNAAVIATCDPAMSMEDAYYFQGDLMSELANGDELWVTKSENGFEYTMSNIGDEFSLDIRPV